MELLQNDRFRKGLSAQEKFLKRQAAEDALHEIVRGRERSITVMSKRDAADGYRYRCGTGVGLGNLIRRIGLEEDLLLITSFRGGITKHQNERDFGVMLDRLHSRFDAERTRAYWLMSHWTKCEDAAEKSEVHDLLEYSWLFYKGDKHISPDEWLQVGIGLAKDFNQSAFIVRVAGVLTVRTSNGSMERSLSDAEEVEQAWQQESERRMMASAYPAVEGSGVAFTPHVFLAIPHNNSGRMMFACKGIDYRVPGVVIPGNPTGKPTVWEPRA